MTAKNTIRSAGRFRLPDPPEREADEVTAFDHIYQDGSAHHLAMHFGKLDTTMVTDDRWIVNLPTTTACGSVGPTCSSPST